jgi:hypothetical protein
MWNRSLARLAPTGEKIKNKNMPLEIGKRKRLARNRGNLEGGAGCPFWAIAKTAGGVERRPKTRINPLTRILKLSEDRRFISERLFNERF